MAGLGLECRYAHSYPHVHMPMLMPCHAVPCRAEHGMTLAGWGWEEAGGPLPGPLSTNPTAESHCRETLQGKSAEH